MTEPTSHHLADDTAWNDTVAETYAALVLVGRDVEARALLRESLAVAFDHGVFEEQERTGRAAGAPPNPYREGRPATPASRPAGDTRDESDTIS